MTAAPTTASVQGCRGSLCEALAAGPAAEAVFIDAADLTALFLLEAAEAAIPPWSTKLGVPGVGLDVQYHLPLASAQL